MFSGSFGLTHGKISWLLLPVIGLWFNVCAAVAQDSSSVPQSRQDEVVIGEQELKDSSGEARDSNALRQDDQQEEKVSAKANLNVDLEQTLFSGRAPQSIEEFRFMEQKFAEIAESVKPAIVNIQLGGSQGSGVVVTSDGYVLTAAHVIVRPNQTATITFPDNRKVKATTLGIGRRIDSGILKINDSEGDDFPYVDIGISDGLKEGQWVMAIGHPGGIDEKRGLVLRVGRVLSSSERVIQTDCTLVGGDSGGPLFDLNGEVVGIHSRIGSNLWDNLHVPVDTYSGNWDLMIQGLVVDGRATLGIGFEEDSLKIERVNGGSAASRAGIKEGDIIKKIGEFEIEKIEDVRTAMSEYLPYMKIDVVVLRDDEELTLSVTLGPY